MKCYYCDQEMAEDTVMLSFHDSTPGHLPAGKGLYCSTKCSVLDYVSVQLSYEFNVNDLVIKSHNDTVDDISSAKSPQEIAMLFTAYVAPELLEEKDEEKPTDEPVAAVSFGGQYTINPIQVGLLHGEPPTNVAWIDEGGVSHYENHAEEYDEDGEQLNEYAEDVPEEDYHGDPVDPSEVDAVPFKATSPIIQPPLIQKPDAPDVAQWDGGNSWTVQPPTTTDDTDTETDTEEDSYSKVLTLTANIATKLSHDKGLTLEEKGGSNPIKLYKDTYYVGKIYPSNEEQLCIHAPHYGNEQVATCAISLKEFDWKVTYPAIINYFMTAIASDFSAPSEPNF